MRRGGREGGALRSRVCFGLQRGPIALRETRPGLRPGRAGSFAIAVPAERALACQAWRVGNETAHSERFRSPPAPTERERAKTRPAGRRRGARPTRAATRTTDSFPSVQSDHDAETHAARADRRNDALR